MSVITADDLFIATKRERVTFTDRAKAVKLAASASRRVFGRTLILTSDRKWLNQVRAALLPGPTAKPAAMKEAKKRAEEYVKWSAPGTQARTGDAFDLAVVFDHEPLSEDGYLAIVKTLASVPSHVRILGMVPGASDALEHGRWFRRAVAS